MDATSSSARTAARSLVVCSLVAGAGAFVAGAVEWGFLGVSVGASGWLALFLLGVGRSTSVRHAAPARAEVQPVRAQPQLLVHS